MSNLTLAIYLVSVLHGLKVFFILAATASLAAWVISFISSEEERSDPRFVVAAMVLAVSSILLPSQNIGYAMIASEVATSPQFTEFLSELKKLR